MEIPEELKAAYVWQIGLFSLGMIAITYVVRRLVETFWKGARSNRYWVEAAIPTLPIVLGGTLAALFASYPYPEGIKTGVARAFFGAGCGFMSAWMYRLFRVFVKKKTGVDDPRLEAIDPLPPTPRNPSEPPAS